MHCTRQNCNHNTSVGRNSAKKETMHYRENREGTTNNSRGGGETIKTKTFILNLFVRADLDSGEMSREALLFPSPLHRSTPSPSCGSERSTSPASPICEPPPTHSYVLLLFSTLSSRPFSSVLGIASVEMKKIYIDVLRQP